MKTLISELDVKLARNLLIFSEDYLSQSPKSFAITMMAKDIIESAKKIIELYEIQEKKNHANKR